MRPAIAVSVAALISWGGWNCLSTAEEVGRRDADGLLLPASAVYRLGTTCWRHNGDAYFVAWSPDGKRLAVTSNYRQIRIFDAESGILLQLLAPRDAQGAELPEVFGVAYSPDGSELAVRAPKATIHTYVADTGDHKRTYETRCQNFGNVEGILQYSPDGKFLAASFSRGDAGSYAVIDRRSGEPIIHEALPSWIRGLNFNTDSSQLTVVATKPGVRVWDLKKRQIVRRSNSFAAADLKGRASVSADGRWVASGEQEIAILDAAQDRIITRLAGDGAKDGFVATAFTLNGELFLAADSQAKLYVWNTTDWSRRSTLISTSKATRDIAIRPDGKRAALLCGVNRVFVWNLEREQLLGEEKPQHLSSIRSVTVSPDGKTIATGTFLAETRLWNSASGEHLQILDTSSLRSVFAENGRQIVTAGRRMPEVQVLDVKTGDRIHEWKGDVFSSSLSANHRVISILGLTGVPRSYQIQTFTLPSLAIANALTFAGIPPNTHAISADGRLAALPSPSGLDLWDIHTDTHAVTFPDIEVTGDALGFTPDGRYLVAGCQDKTLRVWELATLRPVHICRGHKRTIFSLGFDPTGRIALAGEGILSGVIEPNDPQRIVFWDLASGKQIATLVGHNADVYSLAVSPDGSWVVSGLRDTTALVWKTPAVALSSGFPTQFLRKEEVATLWDQLGAIDPIVAQRAIIQLAGDPDQALATAESRLKPLSVVNAETLAPNIAKLDSDEFSEREAAFNDLAKLGSLISSELKSAMRKTESAEARLRLGKLIKLAETKSTTSPIRLAEIRAVQLLEWIGNDRAAIHLRKLASGNPDGYLTKEATQALARLRK